MEEENRMKKILAMLSIKKDINGPNVRNILQATGGNVCRRVGGSGC